MSQWELWELEQPGTAQPNQLQKCKKIITVCRKHKSSKFFTFVTKKKKPQNFYTFNFLYFMERPGPAN